MHLREKLVPLLRNLDERGRRLVLGAEARSLGRGGIERVHRATGAARSTISRGVHELAEPPLKGPRRIRRPGGGRKPTVQKDSTLRADLEALVEPAARGDPESPFRWTAKGLRILTEKLRSQDHQVSTWLVGQLLMQAGYSLQGNRKTKEGSHHPDRNAQFEHINARALALQKAGQPVISVDAKKKELVGDFRNAGKEWRPKGKPQRVRVHDFLIPEKGKAIPYGVYDLTRNAGWVSVGIDHDTASFAVNSIQGWWQRMGKAAYPRATSLMVTADSGGSNAARSRLWKLELQRFADKSGLSLHICHFPPGTSKWNKIEHRLFSFITQNWRGQPLVDLATIVSLIGATWTRTGLRVRAELDPRKYPVGRKISDEELASVQLSPDTFHGEWNYTITPHAKRHY